MASLAKLVNAEDLKSSGLKDLVGSIPSARTKTMIEHTLCPICDSSMKRTMGKHGAYWRCSRWGCDGTRDNQGRSKKEKDEAYERNGWANETKGKRRYE